MRNGAKNAACQIYAKMLTITAKQYFWRFEKVFYPDCLTARLKNPLCQPFHIYYFCRLHPCVYLNLHLRRMFVPVTVI